MDGGRLLDALQRLLAIRATDMKQALQEAADLLNAEFGADKVDVMLLEPETTTLVAQGTSDTPMGRLQHELGLHRLPLANGGRIVEAYETGESYFTGRADLDPVVLTGIKGALGVRSMVAAAFEELEGRRGVLTLASAQPDFFARSDVGFFEAVARWVGLVVQRAKLVDEMRRRAEEEGRRLAADELIAVLAHDLRNYLTPTKARIQMIRREAQRDGREGDVERLDLAVRDMVRLERLIADLLDSSRLERGAFAVSPEPTDLVGLAEETAEALRPAATGEVVVAPANGPVPVRADPERVRQAAENLVANAIQHSPVGTPVVLRVELEEAAGGRWGVLTVCDEGPGIPPEQQRDLFTRFSTGAGSLGLGLGLYIARRVAEAHGGTLTVESSAGEGASFRLALPAA